MGSYIDQPEFATEAAVCTPSDTISVATNLNSSALYVGTGGDVNLIMYNVTPVNGGDPTSADAILFKNVPDGGFLPVITGYVLATGTTATDIVRIK